MRWTNAEKQLIEDALVDIFFVNPDRLRERALAEAQEKLPMQRRLVINAQRVFTHKKLFERAKARGAEMRKAKARSLQPAPSPTSPLRAVDPMSIEILLGLLVDRITDTVCAKVKEQLRKEYGESIEGQFDAELAKHNSQLREDLASGQESTTRHPVSLVIGLLPIQANKIREQFKHDPIDLRFFTSEEAKSRQWPRVDRIYLMTSWVSHSIQSKVQASGTPYSMVNGTTSELSRIINMHLNQRVGHP